jgi:hypothetical protein
MFHRRASTCRSPGHAVPESSMPSQPVRSLLFDFRLRENCRHSRGLCWRARVSGRQIPDFRVWAGGFEVAVSARHFPISVSACPRPVRYVTETGLRNRFRACTAAKRLGTANRDAYLPSVESIAKWQRVFGVFCRSWEQLHSTRCAASHAGGREILQSGATFRAGRAPVESGGMSSGGYKPISAVMEELDSAMIDRFGALRAGSDGARRRRAI